MKKRGKDRLCIVSMAVLALAFTLAGCESPGGGGSGSYVQYKVTFNATGGTVTPGTKKVLAGEAMEILPTPTKTSGDMEFLGWFTGNGESGGEWGSEFLASTPVTANITVYAKWGVGLPVETVLYTVTFNASGGTVTPATKKVLAGEAMEILPTPIKTSGDTEFLGWFTGNGESGGDWGSEFLASTPVTANITVYAKWGSGSTAGTAISITIGFEYGALAITGGDGVNLLSKNQAGERPGSLTLSAAAYTGIKWYIDGAATTTTTGTLTIDAAAYASQIHSVTFTGWKNGAFYSSEPIAFTVME